MTEPFPEDECLKKHLPAGPFHICRALLRAVQGQGYLGGLDSPNGNNILGECLGGVRGFYSKHFDDGRDHPLLRRAPRSSPYFDESGCCVYGPSTDCQRRDGCDGVPNVRQMYSPKLQQVGLAMGIAGQIGALVCPSDEHSNAQFCIRIFASARSSGSQSGQQRNSSP